MHTAKAETSPELAWSQSYLLESKQRYAEALEIIRPFTNNQQMAELARLREGWLLYLEGQYSEAIVSYSHALKLNPKSLDARLGLTLPLMAQNRWQEALQQSQLATHEASGNFTAQMRLLSCEYALKKWDLLTHHAEALTQQFSSESLPWLYLAYAQYYRGDLSAAHQSYQQVLVRDPNNVQAKKGLQGLAPTS